MVPPHRLVLDTPPQSGLSIVTPFTSWKKLAQQRAPLWLTPLPPSLTQAPQPRPPPAAVRRPLAGLIGLSGFGESEVGENQARAVQCWGEEQRGGVGGWSVKSLWAGRGVGIHWSFAARPVSGWGQGRGVTAVLVSQADQGDGVQALLRARKTLPRVSAWFPVINHLAAPRVLQVTKGWSTASLCPGPSSTLPGLCGPRDS